MDLIKIIFPQKELLVEHLNSRLPQEYLDNSRRKEITGLVVRKFDNQSLYPCAIGPAVTSALAGQILTMPESERGKMITDYAVALTTCARIYKYPTFAISRL